MFSNTPMLRQYKEIKDLHKDCILFFRMGDFYEMFGDDAVIASKELEIVLTARDAGAGNKIPMCGVPYHSAENYISALIQKGYKVAICEQTEDPALAKGIVKREVVRIITPGTLIDGKLLEDNKNNFLLAVHKNKKNIFGIAAVDISTGEFYTTEVSKEREFFDEITKYSPSEIITSEKDNDFFKNIISKKNTNIIVNSHFDYAFNYDFAEKWILNHLKIQSLTSVGLSEFSNAVIASGGALDYLKYNQKNTLSNLFKITYYQPEEKMILDYPTRKNLEIFESNNISKKNTALLGVIDYTKTAMGSRKLKSWLSQPLTDLNKINNRLGNTKAYLTEFDISSELRNIFEEIYDLERILAKVTFETANARDLIALKNSLKVIPLIKENLSMTNIRELKNTGEKIDSLEDLFDLLERSINEDPPFTVREGNLIKDTFNPELDELREITQKGKEWISALENKEKEKTGIKNLKIGFNKVFGYYLEITKSNIGQAPDYFIRKQTLANAERYITPELKEMEAKVIGADDKIKKLEYELFSEIRKIIKENYSQRIISTADLLSEIDVYVSMAFSAQKNNFTCPVMNDGDYLSIEALRHPVVEKNLEGEWYTPNDVFMNQDSHNFLIITGPNMGGKSTYCRSIAIAAILAQTGSFVPAKYAELPVFDRIFARIGASDDLTTGQSTFMVEMNEVSNIINNATSKSLIILDEVGRGTSTYDGLSLAWALTEYLSQKVKGKSLFATHYHELTELENKYENIKNLNVKVEEEGTKIVFLHEISPGKADRSYGIQVAELAGLPKGIIKQAKKILNELEKDKNNYRQLSIEQLMSANEFLVEETIPEKNEIIEELSSLDVNSITPLEALKILAELKEKITKEV
ncbi:MAG: DNA mismatch repair protein MutS [Eubacteriales bacterium]|nr:DNA mismatch repair protein MutS [Eubacteriales bacterium]